MDPEISPLVAGSYDPCLTHFSNKDTTCPLLSFMYAADPDFPLTLRLSEKVELLHLYLALQWQKP